MLRRVWPPAYFPWPWNRGDEFSRATRKESEFSVIAHRSSRFSRPSQKSATAIHPGPALITARSAKRFVVPAMSAGSHSACRPPTLRRPWKYGLTTRQSRQGTSTSMYFFTMPIEGSLDTVAKQYVFIAL